MERLWIDLEGLANLRDVGGIPTRDGGAISAGRLLRSDNLQTLTPADIDRLLGLGLTDVVDLRSEYEVSSEGAGPLTGHRAITIHQHSLFREWREGVGEDKPDSSGDDRPEELPDQALPWVDLAPTVQVDHPVTSFYLSYLADRPDSVLASLRHIGAANGATLVHCAAGKDRTGTIVALALSVAGADQQAIVDDYAASSERMEAIVRRLLGTRTYADSLRDRPMSSHLTHPETMGAFLQHVDNEYGGVEPLLTRIGWTDDDSARLRAKLRE
ncbi:MAG: tyrosine-protein phosphatase [Microlunatus sp.]|nr:tyrosine-protein phosphatase [Microlunatus sp.]MDN5771225.1 tyrosine-protein phosphatase [Microlunatus sp.]